MSVLLSVQCALEAAEEQACTLLEHLLDVCVDDESKECRSRDLSSLHYIGHKGANTNPITQASPVALLLAIHFLRCHKCHDTRSIVTTNDNIDQWPAKSKLARVATECCRITVSLNNDNNETQVESCGAQFVIALTRRFLYISEINTTQILYEYAPNESNNYTELTTFFVRIAADPCVTATTNMLLASIIRSTFTYYFAVTHYKQRVILRQWRYAFKQRLLLILSTTFRAWRTVTLDPFEKEQRRRKDLYLANCIFALRKRRVKLRINRADNMRLKRVILEAWHTEVHKVRRFKKEMRVRLQRCTLLKMWNLSRNRMAWKYYLLMLVKNTIRFWRDRLWDIRYNVKLQRWVLRKSVESALVRRFQREHILRPLLGDMVRESRLLISRKQGQFGVARLTVNCFRIWRLKMLDVIACKQREYFIQRNMTKVIDKKVKERVKCKDFITHRNSSLLHRCFTTWALITHRINPMERKLATFWKCYIQKKIFTHWKRRLMQRGRHNAQLTLAHQHYVDRQLYHESFVRWKDRWLFRQRQRQLWQTKSFHLRIQFFYHWHHKWLESSTTSKCMSQLADEFCNRWLLRKGLSVWIELLHRQHKLVFAEFPSIADSVGLNISKSDLDNTWILSGLYRRSLLFMREDTPSHRCNTADRFHLKFMVVTAIAKWKLAAKLRQHLTKKRKILQNKKVPFSTNGAVHLFSQIKNVCTPEAVSRCSWHKTTRVVHVTSSRPSPLSFFNSVFGPSHSFHSEINKITCE